VVAQSSTCRRHVQYRHKGAYAKWCEANDFESKLPNDVKARRDEAKRRANPPQSTLDTHLEERPQQEIAYSDAIFEQAAIEWLIATDQPVQAMEHPKFRNMIHIAARVTRGVKIPERKGTRKAIVRLFKRNLTELSSRLRV
ncbi:hypothetical protein BKA70DRAFT_1028515, partial [Coprinopsis sp. MPI-PUGE-AT-0042]